MRGPQPYRWLPALLITATLSAHAGSLRVGPTIIMLDAEQPVATLRVTNNNPTVTAIEAKLVAWRQADNEDVYEATDQLIVTPPIFELAPGETQIIRAGLRDPALRARQAKERAFRVFIAELPSQSAVPGAQVQTLMRVGVPIFIRAASAAEEPTLQWRLHRPGRDNWNLQVSNTGSTHARVVRAVLAQGDTPLAPELPGLYVLPGSERSWIVPVSKPPFGVNLRVTLREGTRDVALIPSE